MSHRKIICALFVATFGASFMHQASAQWGTGGATKIPRKSDLSGYNLFCDFSRASFGGYTIPDTDRAKITTTPSATNPTPPASGPSLTFQGQTFCAEVLPTDPSPSLEGAVVVNGVPLVGRFTLTQRSPAQRPTSTLTQTDTGLVFSGPEGVDGVRTWTFVVPASPQFPFPELLYDLVPDKVTPFSGSTTAAKFCPPGVADCKLLIGLQLPATQTDYPARYLSGQPPSPPDLALGQVFKFTTKTTGGVEAPGQFFWGPCRADAFGTPQTVVVDANLNSTTNNSGGAVTGAATPVSLTQGTRFAVTVNQNDLWTSGTITDGIYRWSNADGQVRNIFATGRDDSQANSAANGGPPLPGQQIGANLGTATPAPVYVFNGTAWLLAPNGVPIGSLVGSTDGGTTFFLLGTAFDGPAPSSGPLTLYYWDINNSDNTGSVEATVATESIRCSLIDNSGQPVPLTATGNLVATRQVAVQTDDDALNVSNSSTTAGFEITIFGCDQGPAQITFGPGGTPIVLGTTVLVNGKSVAIKSRSVENDGRGPTTCDSGTKALPDLNLKLNQLQFINAVAPGGKCKNGRIGYTITLGNATDGFYGGQSTVKLSYCK